MQIETPHGLLLTSPNHKYRKMAPVAARSAGAVGIGTAIFLSLVAAYFFCDRRNNSSKKKKKKISTKGIVDAIGNTPLIRINSLSDATGCEVILIFFFQFFFVSVACTLFYRACYNNSDFYSLDFWEMRVFESWREC